MDYFRSLFNQEFNDEGMINIRGYEFTREKILFELDPEAYEEAFQDWKNERKENLLNTANRLLTISDNQQRFLKLKNLFSSGKILPFIGAGLSMGSGLKGWKDFLMYVKENSLPEGTEFDLLLKEGKFEEAAQCLEDNDENYLQEQLENEFGLSLGIERIQGVVRRLPEFLGKQFVTTNYDDILKTVLFHHSINSEVLYGLDAHEFAKILATDSPVLLKLHGTFISKNKRILTLKDYERHYSKGNTIKDCIYTLCFSRTMLFLGCSLSSDRIIRCMQELVQEKGTANLPKHYTFLSCNELSTDEIRVRRKELQKANIYPIWYDGDHDECIEALLEKLKEI